jgi:hypothetical protein
MYGNRLDAQLFAGTNDTQGDLAPIGNQNLMKHKAVISKISDAWLSGKIATGEVMPETCF